MRLADTGPVRLGSLADAPRHDRRDRVATSTRSSQRGLAERRLDLGDARGVLVATREGAAEVRARRRRLARLAGRALSDLSVDEARRVANALDELRALLDRR